MSDTDLPNGVDTAYGYDGAGRLESVVNTDATPATISSFDYTLDAVGNRTAMEDLDGTHSYEYDPLYRLTEVTYPDPETDAYNYDAVGNRLTRDTDDYTYDAADQLTDLEGTSFDYDDNGNQTDRGSDTFEYDHENRLTETVIDSVTSTSVYNGDGLRMSHTVGQTTTDYVWDVAAGLPLVLRTAPAPTSTGSTLSPPPMALATRRTSPTTGWARPPTSPTATVTSSLATPTTSSARFARSPAPATTTGCSRGSSRIATGPRMPRQATRHYVVLVSPDS